MTFARERRFGLVDTGHRGLEGKTTVRKKEESVTSSPSSTRFLSGELITAETNIHAEIYNTSHVALQD
jgi:hypothetical protein